MEQQDGVLDCHDPVMVRRRRRAHQVRRVVVAIALVISACAGATPATATTQERATCAAVYRIGEVANRLLSGAVPPGDEGAVRALVVGSQEIEAGASMAANPALVRNGTKLAAAAAGLDAPPGEVDDSPQALVLAFRSLLDACRSLGVDAADVGEGDGAADDGKAPVLRAGDVDGGWDVEPHVDEDSYARFAAAFRRCVGAGFNLPWGPMVHSSNFVQGGGARQVRSGAIHVGPEDADALLEVMADSDAPGCMADIFRRSFQERRDERFTVIDVRTEAPSVRAAGTASFRTTLQLDVGGRPVTVFVDDVYVVEDGWFGRVQLLGTFEPLDRADLVTVFRERLAGAPGAAAGGR